MHSTHYRAKLVDGSKIGVKEYHEMLKDFEILEDTLTTITNAVYDHEPDNWTVDLASTILYNLRIGDYGEGKTYPIDKIGKAIYDNLEKKDKED